MKKTLLLFAVIGIFSCKEGGDKASTLKTPSGYEYVEHIQGEGEVAKLGDYVKFNYALRGSNGKVLQPFSTGELATLMIPKEETKLKENPFTELFNGVNIGDSISLMIPIDSLPNKGPGLDSMEYLQYDIAVKQIISESDYKEEQEAKQRAAQALAEKMQAMETEIADIVSRTLSEYKSNNLELETTDSGLKIHIHEKGSGKMFKKGDSATVNYYGVLVKDGSMFDNSYFRGSPFNFKAGQGMVIAGWDEAIQKLPQGTKASLFIPSDQAYGATDRPGIPANSELMFYIDIQ